VVYDSGGAPQRAHQTLTYSGFAEPRIPAHSRIAIALSGRSSLIFGYHRRCETSQGRQPLDVSPDVSRLRRYLVADPLVGIRPAPTYNFSTGEHVRPFRRVAQSRPARRLGGAGTIRLV
jgi:hypothetical protein